MWADVAGRRTRAAAALAARAARVGDGRARATSAVHGGPRERRPARPDERDGADVPRPRAADLFLNTSFGAFRR